MSFNSLARRVRDASLPYRWRVSALRSCVTLYQPLGWHTTLSFLEEAAGPFRRDEDALLRALDMLDRSRLSRSAAQQVYAERRRQEKRDGRRVPRPGDPDPTTLRMWFGDGSRAAAVHALRHDAGNGSGRVDVLRASSAADAREVAAAVDAFLADGGGLPDGQLHRLAELQPGLYDRTGTMAYVKDPNDYRRASAMLRIVRLLIAAADRP